MADRTMPVEAAIFLLACFSVLLIAAFEIVRAWLIGRHRD